MAVPAYVAGAMNAHCQLYENERNGLNDSLRTVNISSKVAGAENSTPVGSKLTTGLILPESPEIVKSDIQLLATKKTMLKGS